MPYSFVICVADDSEHGSKEPPSTYDGAEGEDGKWAWPGGPDETDYPYGDWSHLPTA